MHTRPQKTSEGDVLGPLAVSIMRIGLWISVFVIVKTNDRGCSHSTRVDSCSRALTRPKFVVEKQEPSRDSWAPVKSEFVSRFMAPATVDDLISDNGG